MFRVCINLIQSKITCIIIIKLYLFCFYFDSIHFSEHFQIVFFFLLLSNSFFFLQWNVKSENEFIPNKMSEICVNVLVHLLIHNFRCVYWCGQVIHDVMENCTIYLYSTKNVKCLRMIFISTLCKFPIYICNKKWIVINFRFQSNREEKI